MPKAKAKKTAVKKAAPQRKAPAKKTAKPTSKPAPKVTAIVCKRQSKPRGKRRKMYKPCPECHDTGKANGQPCSQCHPIDHVQAKKAARGACMHQDEGHCPQCLAKTVQKHGDPVKLQKLPKDKTVFAVYRDKNGIAYLRVEQDKKEAKFVVNKGFEVELLKLDHGTIRDLYLQPVIGSSVFETAKRLLHPLNDQTTISLRAKEYLMSLTSSEEIQKMATEKKTAKFATVTAPAAKNAKAAKSAASTKATKEAKAPAKKAAGKSNGAAGKGNLDNYTIKVLAKKNELREGTFCHAQLEAAMKSKTVAEAQKKLDASGNNPNKRRIEIAWLVKKGFIQVKEA